LIGLNKKWGYSHLLFSSYDQQLGLVEGDRDATTGQFILFKEHRWSILQIKVN
jgi:iron complex outermembrane receptor protein